MQNCIFCKIINKEIPSHTIWEDEKFVAFLDVSPVNTGHVLVVPREHHEYIFDLDDTLYADIFHAAKRLAKPLQKAIESKRIGLVVEGFGVDHLHVHLIPINEARQMESHNIREATHEELAHTADKIKKYL